MYRRAILLFPQEKAVYDFGVNLFKTHLQMKPCFYSQLLPHGNFC